MNVLAMTDLDLRGRRVLIREDLNVPTRDGAVTSDARIRAALPTLSQAAQAGARVMVMSHLGRPREGASDPALSLAPVAHRLGELLGLTVRLVEDWLDGVDVEPGEIVLCENVRFLEGEKADDERLARRMASLCDIYVMDAFGTAHRAQASTCGVARFAPTACAGPLLAAELDALGKALARPARPLVAIIGGAKVSTKLGGARSTVGARGSADCRRGHRPIPSSPPPATRWAPRCTSPASSPRRAGSAPRCAGAAATSPFRRM